MLCDPRRYGQVVARSLVILGGSAGSIEPLQQIVAPLPPRLEAAVLIVLHLPEGGRSTLPTVFQRSALMRVLPARDGGLLEESTIYIVTQRRHIGIAQGRMRLLMAATEHGYRPSIDLAFRQAAEAYRERTIGVVLSGALDDGAHGLLDVKRLGGLTIVQAPGDATMPSMPEAAIELADPHVVAPAVEIGARIMAEVNRSTKNSSSSEPIEQKDLGPSSEVCPACGGVLNGVESRPWQGYRCRVGHSYSLASLDAAKEIQVEQALFTALRTLEGRADTSNELADRAAGRGNRFVAASFRKRAQLDAERAATVRALLERDGDELTSETRPGAEGEQ